MPVFSHLTLSVTDLEAEADFYVRALGFERGATVTGQGRRLAQLMEIEPSGFTGALLRLGDFSLELLEYEEPTHEMLPRLASAPGLAHFSLVVPDLDAAIAAVVRAGGTEWDSWSPTFPTSGTTSIAFCLDPEGNRFELLAHADHCDGDLYAAPLGASPLGWSALMTQG